MKSKQPITVEEIKSGEIAGREALEFLQNTGEYVFHGSWQRLDEIEPVQAYSHDELDGEPAVCTTSNHDVSIFRSLVNTPKCVSEIRSAGWSNETGEFIFTATKTAMESAEDVDATGYVHVFNKSDFERYRGMEYRTNEKIRPLFIVEVGKDDLPEDIKIIEEK